jgi:hypothetical protein
MIVGCAVQAREPLCFKLALGMDYRYSSRGSGKK